MRRAAGQRAPTTNCAVQSNHRLHLLFSEQYAILFFIRFIIRRILRYFRLKARKDLLSFLFILFVAIDKLNVQARIDHQPQSQKQEEHLEGWEVGHLHATEIVADHVAWTQYQVANAAEHAPIAQAPDIKEKQDGFLEGIAAYPCRLTATGTVVAFVVRATSSTLVLFLGERSHLMRL